MELTESQQQAVRAWVAEGANLSQIQKRLQAEFGVGLTYMDVRLLVLELGAKLKDKPEPKPQPQAPVADADAESSDEAPLDDALPGAAGASKVKVSLDRVVQAGALVSGDVVFSDGTKAKWSLDQFGRLGLNPTKPGYRPTPQDVQEFQVQLRELLAQRGYA